MKARAEAAAATKTRILEAARALLVNHSFEEMTIDAIAAAANTPVNGTTHRFSTLRRRPGRLARPRIRSSRSSAQSFSIKISKGPKPC